MSFLFSSAKAAKAEPTEYILANRITQMSRYANTKEHFDDVVRTQLGNVIYNIRINEGFQTFVKAELRLIEPVHLVDMYTLEQKAPMHVQMYVKRQGGEICATMQRTMMSFGIIEVYEGQADTTYFLSAPKAKHLYTLSGFGEGTIIPGMASSKHVGMKITDVSTGKVCAEVRETGAPACTAHVIGVCAFACVWRRLSARSRLCATHRPMGPRRARPVNQSALLARC